ncbi:NLR family CARD domain-containing protein 4-like [Glandiceps talaboti]
MAEIEVWHAENYTERSPCPETSEMDHFTVFLYHLSEEINDDAFAKMKIICSAFHKITEREVDSWQHPFDMFKTLTKCIGLNEVNRQPAIMVLQSASCYDLATKVKEFGTVAKSGFSFAKLKEEIMTYYLMTASRVNPIPWCDDYQVLQLTHVFTGLNLKHKKYWNMITIRLEEIFCAAQEEPTLSSRTSISKKILIQGDPGTGKTTLCQKLATDFAQKKPYIWDKFDLVIFLEAHDVNGTIVEAIQQLLPICYMNKSYGACLSRYLESNESRLLLVVDGLDEASGNIDFEIMKILQGKSFQHCSVLVTARPHKAIEIQRHFDTIIMNEGYTNDNSIEFIEKYFNTVLQNKIIKNSLLK